MIRLSNPRLKFEVLVVATLLPLSFCLEVTKSGVDCGTKVKGHRGQEEYPEVNLKIPLNSTEIWYENETLILMQNMDVQVELNCEASYPIQWIESYDKDSDGFGGLVKGNVTKMLWNEVKMNDTEVTYKSVLEIQYTGAICSVSNFSCQSVHNQCLQSNVLFIVNQTTDLITLMRDSTDSKGEQPQNFISSELDQSETQVCEAMLTYGLHSVSKPYYGWKCETSNGRSITERNELSICDSASHCNTFYRHSRRGKTCTKKVERCQHCRYSKIEYYSPGFVTCRDHGVLLAQHFFYSVPQTDEEIPDIYMDWSNADPQKMLLLEPFTQETYGGDSVTVQCIISRYYFAYGHRFALEFENGTLKYEEATDGEHQELYNVNRINTTVFLEENMTLRVYCLAPIWNSAEWINQSRVITVLTDPEMATIAYTDYKDEETIYLYAETEVNISIVCMGEGKPSPSVSWIKTVEGSKFTENVVNKSTTEIIFREVTEAIGGDYICEVKNFLGVSQKIFHIVVIDVFKLLMKTLVLLSTLMIFVCLMSMYLCWRKIKEQRNQIRLLTEAEIKEFLEGNLEAVHSNDYLDTSDLIQSLPYNPKFEIPKEMIHIDKTMVLGSGNFGQVLKGSIQLLANQGSSSMKSALKGMSSIDVAVKTVKQNMEVLYFKTLLSEVKIMAYVGKHPNIVTLVGACTQNIRKREIFIAVEFCTYGSMDSFLRKGRSGFVNLVKDDLIIGKPEGQNSYENVNGDKLVISTHNLIKWAREIANGMEFLGSKKIIHGDLATRNVFLTEELIAKIGDFGLSRQLLEYSNYIKNQDCPLPWKWMAIESLQDMKFSVHSDIWAYGVTIWEVFTLANIPYPGVSWTLDFLGQLCNGMRMHKPSYATTKIYNTMLACWNYEPNRRPSFEELKRFFERICEESYPQDYFQPMFQSISKIEGETEVGKLEIVGQLEEPKAKCADLGLSPDSEIAEDVQGYLLPSIEVQHL